MYLFSSMLNKTFIIACLTSTVFAQSAQEFSKRTDAEFQPK